MPWVGAAACVTLFLAGWSAFVVHLDRLVDTWTFPNFVYGIFAIIGFAIGLAHYFFSKIAWNRTFTGGNPTQPFPDPLPNVWTRWIIGPGYLCLFSILYPLALLMTFENIRGSVAWHQTRSSLESKGEVLSLNRMIPAKVPPEQNFASISQLNDFFDYSRGDTGDIRWSNTNALKVFKVFSLPEEALPKSQGASRVKPVQQPTLEDWAQAFREHFEGTETPGKSRLRQFPDYPRAPEGSSSARIVETALSVADPLLQEILQASLRPYSRFPIHYEEGFGTLLPHLASLKSLSRYLQVRMSAKLALGEKDAAFDLMLGAFRIMDAVQEDRVLISQTVRYAQSYITSLQLWSAVEAHVWSLDQWKTLQAAYENQDFISPTLAAWRGERGLAINALDLWIDNRSSFIKEQQYLFPDPTTPGDLFVRKVLVQFQPRGWTRQIQKHYSLRYQRSIDALKLVQTGTDPKGIQALIDEPRLRSEDSFFAQIRRSLQLNEVADIPKMARAIFTSRCAATACALQRYRLEFGSFPDDLNLLVPKYMKSVPINILNGKPLDYIKTSPHKFMFEASGPDNVSWSWPPI